MLTHGDMAAFHAAKVQFVVESKQYSLIAGAIILLEPDLRKFAVLW